MEIDEKEKENSTESGGIVELANMSIISSKDPGSNLGIDRIFSASV
jgi:hypothetical protein